MPIGNLVLAHRLDRAKKRGGVAIYCRSDLAFRKHSVARLSHSNRLEMVWIDVQCGHNRSITIGCAYRPPLYSGIALDFDELENCLRKLLAEGKQVLLCGDLNCNLMQPSLPHVRSLRCLINGLGLYQCVQDPTRVTNSSSTLIDIVLGSDPSLVTGCDSLSCIVSDHNLVVIKTKVSREKLRPKEITYRKWIDADLNAFRNELSNVCWTSVFSCINPEESWELWKDIVVPILNRHAPVVTIKIKHKSGFGLSAATRHLIRSAASQLRMSRCSNNPNDLNLYKK